MSTLASPAIYNPLTGIVVPEIKPPYPPAKVVVVYLDPFDADKKQEMKSKKNQSEFVKAFKATRGILPKDYPDGITYENEIRKDVEKHFQDLEASKWQTLSSRQPRSPTTSPSSRATPNTSRPFPA